MKKCLILANGKPPSKSVITFLQKKAGYEFLICADGGANTAFRLGLKPDVIIGDLDSIEDEIKKYFEKEVIVKKINRQNDTDVEKCLKFAVKKKFSNAILLAGTGDRLDHTIANLSIALKYFEKINVQILHQKSMLKIITSKNKIKTTIGEQISLFAFDEKTLFSSKGLKYPLRNISLPFGKKEGASNEAITNEVEIDVKNGKAFLIREFKIMKEFGFI